MGFLKRVSDFLFSHNVNILERENCLLNQMLDSAGGAIFLVENGRIKKFNAKFKDLFDLDDSTVDIDFLDLSLPVQLDGRSSDEKYSEIVEAVLSGNPQVFPWSYRTTSGKTGVCEISFNRIDILRVVGIVLNVSKDRSFQGRYSYGTEMTRFLFEQSPIALQLHRLDGRMMLCNIAWKKLWDQENPETLLDKYNFLQDPQIVGTALEKAFKKALRGQSSSFPKFYYDPALSGNRGRARWIHTNISPISDENCNIVNVIVSNIDITSQVQAEESLRKSEERIKLILKAIPDIMFRMTVDGVYIDFWSPKDEMLAISPRNIIGTSIDDLPDAYVRDLTKKKVRECIETGELQVYEYDLQVPAGLKSFEARLVKSGDNEILAIVRDVTTKKRVEQKLVEAQRIDSIGNLAAGIAHDFNNMLGGIKGFASLLNESVANDKQRRYLASITSAADRASELTRKLLAFGRKGKNLVQPVNMSRIGEEVVSLLKHSIDKSVKIVPSLADGLPSIDADPTQMHQLFMNLCINAAEAMSGGGTLSIETRAVNLGDTNIFNLESGGHVEISISDTGSGIDENIRKHIFEPFFTTKKNGQVKGTGLGLSTVYGIVNAHGGAIEFESQVGVGTKFYVVFPVGKREDKMENIARKSKGVNKGLNATVLVVEDEPILRDMAAAMIEALGYSVLSAENGSRALDLFRVQEGRIDLVLLDMKMPGLSGKETFLEIHRMDSSVPVLLTTGFGQNEEAQEILDMGAVSLLPKPYSLDDLSGKLGELLGKK